MLVMNLKYETIALASIDAATMFAFDKDKEQCFGIMHDNMETFMPGPFLVSNDYETRKPESEFASLLRSSLVLKHPARNSIYDCQNITSEARIENLCLFQHRFFHWPLDTHTTPVPAVLLGKYGSQTISTMPIGFSSQHEMIMSSILLPCLLQAFGILRSTQPFAACHYSYAPLSEQYMKAHEESDIDARYTKTVTLAQWKLDDESTAMI
jgi:hypothetical protein